MNGKQHTDPLKLVQPDKTDKEIADEIRAEIIESAKPYLAAITRAHRAGFTISVAMSPNAFNEVIIQQLTIAKQF